MFSENWDFEDLNKKADQILEQLSERGLCQFLSISGESIPLPATPDIESKEHIMLVCSGFPEYAGAWSYTFLEESVSKPDMFRKTTMAPYFETLPENMGMVIINPHAIELKIPPEESIPLYLSQLKHVYTHLMGPKKRFYLFGFSLGGDVILRFLQENSHYVENTEKLIFIDPSPPKVGRRKLKPEVANLLDTALFYGLCDTEGNPGEFAEIARMRLKVKPKLIECDVHGAMPNLVWPLIQKQLKEWTEEQ